MGCKVARINEDAIKSTSFHINPIRVVPEINIFDASEGSLKECSLIPIVPDNKRRSSDDPSIYKMIQELKSMNNL